MGADRYSEGEVQAMLELYQALFPARSAQWDRLTAFWDFRRTRPWSCLTTNFHEVTVEQVLAFDAARRRWCPSGDSHQDGQVLASLVTSFGCGFSLGISPWTDSVLHSTVTPDTKNLIALIGHDWYPIVPKRGSVEARPPLDLFRLLDSTDPHWKGYADGLPSAVEFKQAGVGLLFLNMVPDFRPPESSAEKAFPFHAPTFDYSKCVSGLLAAIESAHDHLPIRSVVTWGSHAWEQLRDHAIDQAPHLGVTAAAHQYGGGGYPLSSGDRLLRVHPFPHPTPGKRHLLWTPELGSVYRNLWKALLR